jgi:hypothetical protein
VIRPTARKYYKRRILNFLEFLEFQCTNMHTKRELYTEYTGKKDMLVLHYATLYYFLKNFSSIIV